jgi:hypothetical protein
VVLLLPVTRITGSGKRRMGITVGSNDDDDDCGGGGGVHSRS